MARRRCATSLATQARAPRGRLRPERRADAQRPPAAAVRRSERTLRPSDRLCVRADPVRHRADAVDLELDGLPGPDPAVELQTAAAGHRAGRDDVAGVELLARR